MSRLSSLSPAALRAMFSQESDDTLITLVTITGPGISTPIRLADGYTQRISETDDDVVYGVTSRGNDYIFLPLQITLPTEEQTAAPRCTITINDVTRYLTPVIREINSAPSVTLELVLASSPNTVEASFPGFLMAGIQYNADTVTAELTVETLTSEPFPAHQFTPSSFPGLF
jgi:hypothetical protein